MLDTLAQSWLALQCRMIAGTQRAIVIVGAGGAVAGAPTATWPAGSSPTPALAAAARLALSRRNAVIRGADAGGDGAAADGCCSIACPLRVNGQVTGVVALELEPRPPAAQRDAIRTLTWGATWLDFMARRELSSITGRLVQVVEVVVTALEHASFADAATAIATDLARRHGTKGGLSLPLAARGHVVGALTL